MFKIEPGTLYSKRDLAQALAGTCDVDRLLDRIRPKAVVQGVYLGRHLIEAMDRAADWRELQDAKQGRRSRTATGKRSCAPNIATVSKISREEIGA